MLKKSGVEKESAKWQRRPRLASSLPPLMCLFSHSVCVREEEESRVVPKKDGHNGAEKESESK